MNNSIDFARKLLKDYYGIEGKLKLLAGELDLNYKVDTDSESYILKISNPETSFESVDFQGKILEHISSGLLNINSPELIKGNEDKYIFQFIDSNDEKRLVRLLSWIDGRLFSTVNPITDELLLSLGNEAGSITKILNDFEDDFAHRDFDWDLAKFEWTYEYLDLFDKEKKELVGYFKEIFDSTTEKYQSLRKSIIHNDVNDNNIVVSNDLSNPKVIGIIDYGDAIYSQTINDLAVCIAYGAMNKPDPLSASLEIIKGYNSSFLLLEKELEVLYVLVAIRLIISVTKSAINKKKEPENEYLQISEKPAWELLDKWKTINPRFAYYSFRSACNFDPHPSQEKFIEYSIRNAFSVSTLFPSLCKNELKNVDLSVSSTIIGQEYYHNDLLALKIKKLELEIPSRIFSGGYLETRPIYVTDAYKKEGNNGPEYRSVHLGVDFWVEPRTPIFAPLNGTVYSAYNNSNDKDYGPTVILKHDIDEENSFFTLYGHLSEDSLKMIKEGKELNKGDQIGYVGNNSENGNWVPHLHFQIILDMLENRRDFPGVAFPNEINIWKSICPDPNLFIKSPELKIEEEPTTSEILSKRKQNLGKSLSVSYNKPLHIVRGRGQFLLDISGRKYLDTVNNVAHVGHEHPEVVKAGQEQMAVLNTNTRYVHEGITKFAELLLETFPKELSVLHFVNSGSEANELALRMAKVFTDQRDMIAVEVGYHGNTSGCVDVSSYKFDGKGGMGAPENTHIIPLPDSFRGIYRGENTGEKYAKHIDDHIEKVNSKNRGIAGFICESIISCGGQIELPENYLSLSYEKIRNAGGICIADEVQVGCGRVGSHFWGFQLQDVIPDIVTIGKPLGNGHPVAAVVCTQEVAESFNNGMEYFNTFGGNPVSCAIGKKVLDVIKNEKLQLNALNTGNYLKEELKSLQSDFPIIGDVRGHGLFLGFELVDDNKNPETKKAAYLVNRMKELGILMSIDGKDNNVIKIKPPMVFTKENVDELIYRLEHVLNEDFMI